MASTVEWLRARTDDQLAALLAARGDLLLPAPGDLTTLARRVDSAASVRRALAGCTAFDIQLLQALWITYDASHGRRAAGKGRSPGRAGQADPEHSHHSGVAADTVANLLGGPASLSDVAAGLEKLELLGLVRGINTQPSGAGTADCARTGDKDAGGQVIAGSARADYADHAAPPQYTLGPSVREALGRYPAGLGAATGLDRDTVRAAVDSLDDAARVLLDKLMPGPPVGTIPADSPQRSVVERLLSAGLLVAGPPAVAAGNAHAAPAQLATGTVAALRDDPSGNSSTGASTLSPAEPTVREITVALPREVALVLRGGQPLGPAHPDPPPFTTTPQRPGSVDAAAGGRALTAHARTVALLERLGDEPLPALKSGGIGVVPLRKLARALDTEPGIVALYLELAHSAGLIAPALSPRGGAHWLPTHTADTFLLGTETAGWALLADTWFTMRRDPSRVGERDANDVVIAALSAGVDWRSGPTDRRRVLGEIAGLEPDLAAEQSGIEARLAFRAPLAAPAATTHLVSTVIAEATELGLVAFGSLATTGRVLLEGDVPELAAALERILPEPVEEILVQADMTVIAPGRLARHLAEALAEMADVESAGAGAVYRISEASIRRALDAGATRTEMHTVLGTYSRTPIPQSISYLIDDVSRRHGVIRAGQAETFVHSEDPALIAQAAAAVSLRVLAPTVAISSLDLPELVEALRAAGLAAAAEDESGAIVDLRARPRRTRAPAPSRTPVAPPSGPSKEQIDAVVRRMRASADMGATEIRDVHELLRRAAGKRAAVWISYADAEGGISTRAVEPLAVSGGSMIAFDRLRHKARTFSLSRISRAYLDEG